MNFAPEFVVYALIPTRHRFVGAFYSFVDFDFGEKVDNVFGNVAARYLIAHVKNEQLSLGKRIENKLGRFLYGVTVVIYVIVCEGIERLVEFAFRNRCRKAFVPDYGKFLIVVAFLVFGNNVATHEHGDCDDRHK